MADVKAISTYGITLKYGESATPDQEVVIKNFPNLGGAPNLIEVTDLKDAMQTFINGIQTSSAMEFTCNYTKAEYQKIVAQKNKPLYFELSFGEQGIFAWEGQMDAYVTGKGVNEAVEFNISVAPSTKPNLKG